MRTNNSQHSNYKLFINCFLLTKNRALFPLNNSSVPIEYLPHL